MYSKLFSFGNTFNKLKRKLHISFFCLALAAYLLMHIGVPVFKHYCGGELESISVFVKHASCCGEEEDEPSDCCKDEVQVANQYSQSVLSKANDLPQIAQVICFFSTTIYKGETPKVINEIFSSNTKAFKWRQLQELSCSILRI